MPWFATERDRRISRDCELWLEIARSVVDDIGGWRDCHDAKKFPKSLFGNGEPCGFLSLTSSLVAQVAMKFPNLSPTPFQKIYYACNAWHTDWNDDRIPPQNELDSTLVQATILLYAIWEEIESRLRDTPPDEPME